MIKTILLSIQERLASEVQALGYIDKDWGQLSYTQPAVKWPCALLDVDQVRYTQEGAGRQMADISISITVAHMRTISGSFSSSRKEESYKTIELLEEIHKALQLYTNGTYSPLFRSSFRKVFVNSSAECYEITYETAYETDHDKGETKREVSQVKISFR
ncbi:MAG: hypothetical protein LUE98_07610 [Tannerellaceae bacterium]|nr:hypothetical protein [Tannerellaceae bacterium]